MTNPASITELRARAAADTREARWDLYNLAWDEFGLRSSSTAMVDYINKGHTRKSKRQAENDAACEAALRKFYAV